MRRKLLAATLSTLLVASTLAFAHHSHANYDITKWIEIEGTVKQVVFIAPHSLVYLDVKNDKGETSLWALEATVPAAMPEPILFEQGLAWVDADGRAIRYRTLYTEGYADWKFPQPVPPPHTLRDLDASREQPPRPPR